MRIIFADTNPYLIAALSAIAGDLAEVRQGAIQDFSKIAACFVSPANSLGHMDGGIDAVYIHMFGSRLQTAVYEAIAAQPWRYLPVGDAVEVSIDPDCSLIVAPTMPYPMPIPDPEWVMRASHAAMRAALASGKETVVFPGMGTGAGRVPPAMAAALMVGGIKLAISEAKND